VRPPGVKETWDDCGVFTQAMILAFDQICSSDEKSWQTALAGAKMPPI
jgi:hypothetical protein